MPQTARKLFVHVGPPKTGTSALQHVLRTHDDAALIYPKIGLWADGSHHNLVLNFFQDFRRPGTMRSDVGHLFEAIGSEARRSGANVLLSSEMLCDRDVGSFIAGLRRHLGDGLWEPEIIFACREHLEMMSSIYNQRVRELFHLERRGPDEFLQGFRFSYRHIFQRLRGAGVPITALNYHPAETFVRRFLEFVGFSAAGSIAVERRNLSLSAKALVATLAVNNLAKTREDRDRYFAAVRRLRPFVGASRFIFGREAARAAALRFREDRRFVADEFGIELPEIDVERQRNGLFVTDRELAEVAAATRDLGPDGAAIAAFAGRYARSPGGADALGDDAHVSAPSIKQASP